MHAEPYLEYADARASYADGPMVVRWILTKSSGNNLSYAFFPDWCGALAAVLFLTEKFKSLATDRVSAYGATRYVCLHCKSRNYTVVTVANAGTRVLQLGFARAEGWLFYRPSLLPFLVGARPESAVMVLFLAGCDTYRHL